MVKGVINWMNSFWLILESKSCQKLVLIQFNFFDIQIKKAINRKKYQTS